MPFTSAQDLIENHQPPVTVKLDDPVSFALDLMIRSDYSQLPVVDDDLCPRGLITADSILRSLRNFNTTLDKLKVRDAKEKHRVYSSMVSIFDLLESLESYPAVLITDTEDRLIGIITNWDTADYFRRRAEDLMLVEDIETHLKEHILVAFSSNQSGKVNESMLQATIDEVSNAERFTTAKTAVTKYIGHIGNNLLKFDLQSFGEMCQQHLAENGKPLKKLTLHQLILLFLHKSHWGTYSANFSLDKDAIQTLLEKVKGLRNKVAHFTDDVTPSEREALRFAAAWFEDNRPVILEDEPDPLDDSSSETVEESMVVSAQHPISNSRYARLADYLSNLQIDREQINFERIEQIIGENLPPSARTHRSWWANDSVGHVQSQQWLAAGWRVAGVNMTDGVITFSRNRERQEAYINFFSALLNDLRARADFEVYDVSPGGTSWTTAKALPRNDRKLAWLSFSFTRKKKLRVELYIDAGDQESNKRIFDRLYKQKEQIEMDFGEELSWERLDSRRACRIAAYRDGLITDKEEELAAIRSWGVDTMIRFEQAIADKAETAIQSVL